MDVPPTADPAPAYPLLRPASGDDPRFTLGLALDVGAVLTRHHYPPLSTAADLFHWPKALFAAIYQEKP